MTTINNTQNPLRFLLISCIFLFYCCKKEAGYGGDASISGHLRVYEVNGQFTDTIATFSGRDRYIYIRYDQSIGYDKRIKSDYDGNYLFDHLYPGNYEIYTYSADASSPDGLKPIILKIKINGRKEQFIADTLNILQ
ncbi:MAG: hypothetical protein KJS45_10155 [Bacteroidetes bacterium]|nr:hypothetical protein [Bacteroidota bacterium]